MTTLILKINEKSKKGKALLNMLDEFVADQKDIQISREEDTSDVYNASFVEMVKTAASEKDGIKVNAYNLWESIK